MSFSLTTSDYTLRYTIPCIERRKYPRGGQRGALPFAVFPLPVGLQPTGTEQNTPNPSRGPWSELGTKINRQQGPLEAWTRWS